MKGRFFALITMTMLCGCANIQTTTRFSGPGAALRSGSTLYVGVPEHAGRDEERTYPRSSAQTAEACAKTFQQYAQVTLGREPENLQQAFASATAAKCDYLVKPEIRAWEDNPTEWNGERDVLDVDVETFEVATGKSISRAALKGRSRLLTFGDKPERLLAGLFEPYSAELFGTKKLK